jgi:ABC-2 type transport system ATP-binding protein
MKPEPVVHAALLSKHYEVPVREAGLRASTKALVRRKHRTIKAVDQISFVIQPGEVVGFLGPNGAGKTTTLKMLSGLLYPSGGEVRVLGFEPSQRSRFFLQQIALVMGNRNQLAWDLPALDSFELNRAIYAIPEDQFKQTRDEFVEMLDLQELVEKPVRNLSLGERMKMEIVGALLHQPRVLFLDEPTIGLDVTMQRHYMADVEALCKRVIVIHHGKILYDGDLSGLVERFSAYKTISLTLNNGAVDLQSYGEVLTQEGSHATLRVPKNDTALITSRLLSELSVTDLTVVDPPIEDVIETVFARESAEV